VGGAHRDPDATIERLGDAVETAIRELENLSPEALRTQRREKFIAIGRVGLS
ncbi:Acetyl-coenzyme A carboxyl transferase alpha chain, partial [hydrothermal vent metagenome]